MTNLFVTKKNTENIYLPINKSFALTLALGVGSSNNYAYLVVDDKSKDAVIIDPANPPE